ncbi:MAG: fructose 1,6-bisphosphatase [Candidatus Handelsmanbacteria bacterium RIFCSPLOWO2_12_FULL_64_10]|uniref:Fructose-1,6-bisphosphate aldolase/phosphatase n=1 Tax=Handelsmanbacteria sp. (strain RIFCSPLOWO2_12_FULL_64_10) TaxID=1817868 RepID=A0A1F6C537_HANXR|nr:MAG: fructose 1,6-bisphosphatase [Candidatus Handelsmanbacteria bacterium RIFCSPLOWO2_12_FULL_64_10]
MSGELTLSVIKADVGGFVGHAGMHPDLIEAATQRLETARLQGAILDFRVTACGDDLGLILTHRQGVDSAEVHQVAWNVFEGCTQVAKFLKLYGAGQDLLSDAFCGNVRGMGPGVAEMSFEERPAEPVLIFFADKTSAGGWNLPLFKMFADPFNTAGLIISPALHQGFRFDVLDVRKDRLISLNTPEEMYDLLVFIGAPGRFVISQVYSRSTGEIASVSSTQKLALIAGKYVGKDDPVCIVRAQSQFPAVGEALEPFTLPHLVEGWMRGSHCGPLMPCRVDQAHPCRFDGPPRVICLGFQLADGRLVGPQDMFDDPSFDRARQQCNYVADYLRRHGPFEPHRLPMEEMEYTTLPQVAEKLEGRWRSGNGHTPDDVLKEVALHG